MRIRRPRYGVHPYIALDMANQVLAKPRPRLQRLYGNPEDRLMTKADGSRCEVLLLKTFNIHTTEKT